MIPRSLSSATLLLIGVAILAVAPACQMAEPPLADPFLVVEAGGSKSDAIDLVIVDLSGRELVRQPTGSTIPLSTLHEATAQVAFWRDAGAAQELVVWDIATKALKVVATSAIPRATGPIWSLDGTEIVSLHTTTPINWAPGAPFDGIAELVVATVATGQVRRLATDRPFVPTFANSTTIAGASFSGEKKYLVVDARSGKTLHELALNAVLVLPTASPEIVIAIRETSAPNEFTFNALNVRTGAELSRLGPVGGQSFPLWPGRSEVVFIEAGELKAFDYEKNATRVVGRLEGATSALGFDPMGRVLLVARPMDPSFGTFTVGDGRLTSGMRLVPREPSLIIGRALGLVRIKL